MISYPLQLPGSPGPKNATCFQETKAASSTSPYTGKTQVNDWGVDLFHLHLEFPPMTPEQAAPWIQFLRDMRGLVGTFEYDISELLADSLASGESSGSSQVRIFRFKERITSWDISDDRRYLVVIDAIEEPTG